MNMTLDELKARAKADLDNAFEKGKSQGERGEQGIQGEQGERGPKGDKGDKGDKGEDGKAFTYEDLTVENKMDLLGNVSNAFKGQASGELIQLTDISPIVHGIKVKCSVPDSYISVHGKNLISKDITNLDNWEHNATVSNSIAASRVYYLDNLPNGTFTIRAEYVNPNNASDVFLYLYVSNDGGLTWEAQNGKNGTNYIIANKNRYIITFEKNSNNRFLIWNHSYSKHGAFKVQVEMGTEATEIEDYSGIVRYKADADGNAIIPSVYPSTTIFADADGAMIEAEYNKDLNKVFGDIDEALDAILAIQEQYLPQEAVIEDAPETEGGDVE